METIEERPSWTCTGCRRSVEGEAGDEDDDFPSGWAEDGDGDLYCGRCQDEMDPRFEEAEQARADHEERMNEAGDDPYD